MSMAALKVFSDNRAIIWVAASVVATITFLIYLPALQNGFINLDDNLFVYENQRIKSIDLKFLRWAIADTSTNLWHPMLWLSFATDYAIWELNPVGYHLTNNILHAVNTFLVFILVIRLLEAGGYNKDNLYKKSIIIGIVTTLFFGLHPVRVESVAWVAERKDVLYSFFYLLSVFLYLKYASTSFKKYYFLCFICFILSLMSKPMAVTLPAVLLILDFYPLKRFDLERVRDILIEKFPFFLASLLLSATMILKHMGTHSIGGEIYSFQARIFLAVLAYLYYLLKIIMPINVAPISPPFLISGLSSFENIGAFIGITALTVFSVWLVRKSTVLFAVWLYYLVALTPVIGQFGAQPIANHYTYLPSLGPSILMGIGAATLLERYSRRQHRFIIVTVLFLLIGMLLIGTTRHIGIWKDSVTLWSYEIKLLPETSRKPYFYRGTAYYQLGDYRRAIEDFSKTISLDPKWAMAYYNRGIIYARLGYYQSAINDFNEVIEINPKYSEAYYSLGNIYSLIGEMEKASANYQKAADLELTNLK